MQQVKNAMMGALVLAAGAAVADTELYAPMAKDAFALDGNLEENTYAGYDWSEPFRVLDRESATVNGLYAPVEKEYQALKTVVGTFRDEKYLYVVFMAPACAKTPLGDEDRVGAAISADGKSILVVTCDTKGTVEASRVDVTSGARTAVADHGAKAGVAAERRHGRFNVELAIPFALIGRTPDAKGATWRCNFFRTGPSCGGRATWAPMSAQSDLLEFDSFGKVAFDAQKGVSDVVLPENAGKKAFLWESERWGVGTPQARAPLDEPELKLVRLAGPRGARAVAHFRISNLTDAHQLYTLKPDDFEKNAFAKKVRFREMAYLELKGGPVLPDPIFDLPNGSVLRIPPKTTAVVWIDVETAGLKPGVHTAKVRLVPGYSKMEAKELDLELTVGAADVSEIDMPNWAYPIRWPDDYRALRDYGFNVICMGPFQYAIFNKDGSPDWSKFDEVIDAVVSTGVKTNEVRLLFYHLYPNWCNKRTYGTPEFEKEQIESIRRAVEYAKTRHGIGYDRLYFGAKDEPSGDPDEKDTAAWHAFYGLKLARQADPRLKNFTNPWKSEPKYLHRYLESFDTLAPYQFRMLDEDKDVPARFAASGKEIWSYVILVKQNLPAQYRKASWNHLRYGFDGPALFYDLFDCAADPFDSYDRNGGPDYNAVFKDRRTTQVSPSRRLESWYLGHIEQKLGLWCKRRLAEMRAAGKGKAADAFDKRLQALVARAVQARPDYDAIGLELLKLSDEIAAGR